MAAQSRPLAGHVFDSASLPEAVDRVLHWFQRHLVTASVLFRRRPGRMGSWRRVSAALVVALVVTLLLKPPAYAADDGSLDAAFTTTSTTSTCTGANGSLRSLAVQTNQQALLGGAFTTWNIAAVGRVVRLNGTAATGSQSQVVALRAPVIQQFGRPLTGTCDEAALESLNWWGVASGGWAQSWAAWVNDGRGGAVCTRTFRYSTVQSQWIVDEP